jgi:AAA+ superfamily predicted ATPase
VPTISVLVAATPPDVEAEGLSAAIANREDMILIAGRVLPVAEVSAQLALIPLSAPCALVLIGPNHATESLAARCVAKRAGLVALRVDIADHVVQIALRDVTLDIDSLLNAVRGLVDRARGGSTERIARIRLHAVPNAPSESAPSGTLDRPLLQAAMQWIHALLRNALPKQGGNNGDLPGLTLTAATVADLLDARAVHSAPRVPSDVANLDLALTRALAAADPVLEPLAAAVRAFRLTALEFRVVLLALAPELDIRYQRCLGVLLDDLGRKVGTLGLYASLLGEPSEVRRDLAHSGNLARWRLTEGRAGSLPAADEPLRLDPALAGWLLGEHSALDHDARVRRLLRLVPWPGADVFERQLERDRAASLVTKLRSPGDVQWLIFAGEDPSGWCAMLELGAERCRTIPLRVDGARLHGLDVAEVEESGIRLGRLARLVERPVVLDATATETSAQDDDALRLLMAAIGGTGCCGGAICTDVARFVRLLGPTAYLLVDGTHLHATARAANIQAAGKGLDIGLDPTTAEALARQYPIPVDAIEHAMRLARAKRLSSDDEERRYGSFVSACQEIAAENASRLAERITPTFRLADVVLPPDRVRQLTEITDHVRLAPTVLDEWKFREQLPYGRGVAALFYGASGTGKTMAAMAIAKELGVQLLRVDLSRVVSKYIGEMEKNIDRVFIDAHKSGAALLIDEADALFGKRSEVKDAHDRYANIEVAYLLQRMEDFEGLAILTTNMRQNLDPAFLRRLRFIIEFPRPDMNAREKIWRRCLPANSHELDDAAFRQLARRIELTGGSIRQITLRAAFRAAAMETVIGLEHVDYAARAEYAKLGVPPVDLEVLPRKQAA